MGQVRAASPSPAPQPRGASGAPSFPHASTPTPAGRGSHACSSEIAHSSGTGLRLQPQLGSQLPPALDLESPPLGSQANGGEGPQAARGEGGGRGQSPPHQGSGQCGKEPPWAARRRGDGPEEPAAQTPRRAAALRARAPGAEEPEGASLPLSTWASGRPCPRPQPRRGPGWNRPPITDPLAAPECRGPGWTPEAPRAGSESAPRLAQCPYAVCPQARPHVPRTPAAPGPSCRGAGGGFWSLSPFQGGRSEQGPACVPPVLAARRGPEDACGGSLGWPGPGAGGGEGSLVPRAVLPHRRLVTQSRAQGDEQRLLGLRPRGVCREPAGRSLPQSLRPVPPPRAC